MLEMDLNKERWDIVPTNTDNQPLLNIDALIHQSILQSDEHEEFVNIFQSLLNSGETI
jgi:hypothetical protein|tara:strand:+ start:577 stop:750 length:174 start_codon:yes stop_codon:yes gene_type:complete